MQRVIDGKVVEFQKNMLNEHPIYKAVETIEDLRCFMEHHIFSVWDFMSLVKYLQSVIAPSQTPWIPPFDTDLSRFINEIVLEEESDEMPDKQSFLSHFEMYLMAMEEVGADTGKIRNFVQVVQSKGIEEALKLPDIPEASRVFTTTTFSFIVEGEPYHAAAAFSLGREDIIPLMFKAILKKMGVSKKIAPMFHYYLERHIHLDEGFHGPLAMKLLNQMCQEDERKIDQAVASAKRAVEARISFWDGVLAAMKA